MSSQLRNTTLGIAIAHFSHRLNRTVAAINQTGGAAPTGPSALALASQPIVWNPTTMTAAGAMVRSREFRVRQYVEGYQLRGERNPDCDALCLGLVQNWIAGNYGGAYDTNLPPLPELSEKLARDPECTDPLVLTAAAVNSVELQRATELLERAVKGFDSSRHRGYPKFFATVMLADKLVQMRRGTERIPELDALALQRLREAFADGSFQPGDQEELGEIFILTYGQAFFWRNQTALYLLVQDQGKDFRWLAQVLEGEYEINEAWRARGGGYAASVTAQGWQGFSEHLNIADRCLTRAWQMNPSLPLAPSRMIYVSLGNSDLADMRLWFDRTLAAQVDFDQAWKDFRWGLRPRWYGDLDSMLALGVTALNTHHFETDVPRKFFDALGDVEAESDLPPGTHLYGRADIWPHLQEMYEGYLAEPTASNPAGWRRSYSVVAYLAGKYDVAGRQLQAVNWQLDAWHLANWGQDLTVMPLEVAARTGSQRNAVSAAESSRDAGDIASALKEYHELAAATDLDDRTRSFIQERLTTLGLESRLQSGEWVDYLPTDTNLTGWYVERGHCEFNPDGSLAVRSDENGHLLYSRARLGRDFEVRGQFEVQRSSDGSFQGGLVMGLPQFETDNWYAFRVKRNRYEGDVAAFSCNWGTEQVKTAATLDRFTNSFYFRFQSGQVTASVNDREVFHEVAPPRAISVATNQFMLGLGAFNDSNDTVIWYRHLKVRSLTPPAAFQLSTPASQ